MRSTIIPLATSADFTFSDSKSSSIDVQEVEEDDDSDSSSSSSSSTSTAKSTKAPKSTKSPKSPKKPSDTPPPVLSSTAKPTKAPKSKDKKIKSVDEFPCASVDTDALNSTERRYQKNNGDVGACYWTSLKGDWRGASIVSRRSIGAEWMRRFGNDIWPAQCITDVDKQINRHLAATGDRSELFADIPATVEAKPYVNCAVVGNSYALLGRQLGVEIDSHAQVFRINWPPLGAAYARDVGQYTSHMVTNAASINCNQRMPIDEVPVCRSSYPSDVITLTKWRLCYRFLQLTFGERAPPGTTLLISPEWEGALQRMLAVQNKMPDAPTMTGRDFQKWEFGVEQSRMTVSTGLLAVFTALALCQNVDLYGFDGASEFVHSYWEPPRLAGELSETYLAERQIYTMLHNRQLPQKFSKFPLGRFNFRAIVSSAIATSIRHQGTEGGPCEAPKFTCSKALLCHNRTVCINPRLPKYNSLQRGLVGGAGCQTTLPVGDQTDRLLWNDSVIFGLRESTELPHLLYGVTAMELSEVSRFAIAAAESRLLGEQAQRNQRKQQQAIEAQLAGWNQTSGNETAERLDAEAERAAQAEHRAHHKLPIAVGGEEIDVENRTLIEVVGARDADEAQEIAHQEQEKLDEIEAAARPPTTTVTTTTTTTTVAVTAATNATASV